MRLRPKAFTANDKLITKSIAALLVCLWLDEQPSQTILRGYISGRLIDRHIVAGSVRVSASTDAGSHLCTSDLEADTAHIARHIRRWRYTPLKHWTLQLQLQQLEIVNFLATKVLIAVTLSRNAHGFGNAATIVLHATLFDFGQCVK